MHTAKETIQSLIKNHVTRPLVAQALFEGRYLPEYLHFDLYWCASATETYISTHSEDVKQALITFLFGTPKAHEENTIVEIEVIDF